MSLPQSAVTTLVTAPAHEHVRVFDGGEYGFFSAHIHADSSITVITEPLEVDGTPQAHPLEEMAEREAAQYAYQHALPCYFRHDPEGRWGQLAVQQIEEGQERSEATYRSWGWA